MAIQWTTKDVENVKEKEADSKKMGILNCLVMIFLPLGINRITSENLSEVFRRVDLIQSNCYPLAHLGNKAYRITREEIADWIGLRTNIKEMSEREFNKYYEKTYMDAVLNHGKTALKLYMEQIYDDNFPAKEFLFKENVLESYGRYGSHIQKGLLIENNEFLLGLKSIGRRGPTSMVYLEIPKNERILRELIDTLQEYQLSDDKLRNDILYHCVNYKTYGSHGEHIMAGIQIQNKGKFITLYAIAKGRDCSPASVSIPKNLLLNNIIEYFQSHLPVASVPK